MSWLAWAIAAAAAAAAALGGWLFAALRWQHRETTRDHYFARPLAERRALREEIRRRGRRVVPVLAALYRATGLRPPVTRERGVCFPGMACPRADVRRGLAYRPEPADVFVATQMKCGTTWAQQIVYETLCRGRGDLSDAGHRHLYALSPWLESALAVPMHRAPRVGEPPRRIVKTHLPADLCPFSPEARYVYVARHPVACFASCVDFVRLLAGPLAPPAEELLDWFCSDEMWWGAWPGHVEGWWRRARAHENVLFLHYEELLGDLPSAVDAVAGLFGVALAPDEREEVARKSGYGYMKVHEELFEMAPPGFLSEAGGSFLVSGGRPRERDAAPEQRARIGAFVRERLAGGDYPLARFYPDVAGSPGGLRGRPGSG